MDFRKSNGTHGRSVGCRQFRVHDLSTGEMITLNKWDRLCIGGCVRDIYCSYTHLKPPFDFEFWRQHPDCPFKCYPAMLRIPGTQFEYIMQDDLHMNDLGVVPRVEGECIIEVLKSGTLGNQTTEQGLQDGVVTLNVKLRHWYHDRVIKYRLKKSNRKISKIGRLTLKMLKFKTMSSTGHVKAKGAEARDLLPFVHHLLKDEQLMVKLGARGRNLKRAVACLLKASNLQRKSGRSIDHEKLGDLYMKTARACKRAKVKMIPKFHFLAHWGRQTAQAGNPTCYSTYPDETKNSAIVRGCQSCKSLRFGSRVLGKEWLQDHINEQLDDMEQDKLDK